MNIGDRFIKDGKLVEVTSVERWGYGYKQVTEEVFKATKEEAKVEKPEDVFPAEMPKEKPVVKPVVNTKKTVKKPVKKTVRKKA